MRFDEHTNSCGDSELPAIYVLILRILLAGAYFARLNQLQNVDSRRPIDPTMELTGLLLHCETFPIGNYVTNMSYTQLVDGFSYPEDDLVSKKMFGVFYFFYFLAL